MRRTDIAESSDDNSLLTSSRIILFSQSLAVVASVMGLIGLTIAYNSLVRQNSGSSSGSTQPPVIG
jgi:hypothetical protein